MMQNNRLSITAAESSNSPNTITEVDLGNEYPDGGTQAWLVVVGAWCAMIPSMGLLNSLAVLHAWLGRNQLATYSESSAGWIFSTYAFFLFFCGAQIGLLSF
jgi:hypothetical protein